MIDGNIERTFPTGRAPGDALAELRSNLKWHDGWYGDELLELRSAVEAALNDPNNSALLNRVDFLCEAIREYHDTLPGRQPANQ